MIRFMGFATGAAVAVGFMLFLFGAPQTPEVEPAVEPLVELEPAPAPSPTTPPESIAESPPAEQPTAVPEDAPVEVPPVPVVDATPEPNTEPATEAATAAASVEDSQDLAELPEAETRIAVADDAPTRDLQWHAFWSPFRSRIAANGFVSRLESVTGFDYRVVQVDTGVYEVAVGYASDDERRIKLAAIAEATGLEMPDS
ncbi:MAG: hypothetical protein AAFQ62_13115 [Pseudomonadota bacterium]